MAGSTSSWDQVEIRRLIEGALPGRSRATTDYLVEIAKARTARPGEAIFRQGEPIPLTLILRGHGVFRRTTVDGQLLATGVGDPGGMFGFSAIAATNSPVDLVALTECEVRLWKGSETRRLAATDPGLALDAVDLARGVRAAMTEGVDGFLHQDSRRRVIRVLLRHRDLFFGEPAVLSRAELPGLVGTSREMTGRVLRELEREGLVARVGRRGLRLLRPDRLEIDAHSPQKGRRPGWARGRLAASDRPPARRRVHRTPVEGQRLTPVCGGFRGSSHRPLTGTCHPDWGVATPLQRLFTNPNCTLTTWRPWLSDRPPGPEGQRERADPIALGR